MKLIISLLLLVVSLPCLADSDSVRIGDSVEYDFTSVSGPASLRWSVVGFNKARESYSTNVEIKGEGAIFWGDFTKNDVLKLGSTKQIFKDCTNIGGVYEALKTGMGNLTVCHLFAGYTNERWVAKDIRCSDAKRTFQDGSGNEVVATVRSYYCP